MNTSDIKTVAIIGAGPVGLAAAAHALERGMRPIVLEAGPAAGTAVRAWGQVRMFSPWEFNIDTASERLLAAAGWNSPDPSAYPTGADLVANYIEPLATRTVLKEYIKTTAEVIAISRVGIDKVKTKGRDSAPFEIRYRNGKGAETLHADAVLDTSGTWHSPIRLAPTASKHMARPSRRGASLMPCQTYSDMTATVTPVRLLPFSERVIPRSAP